jgi:hypothetical protein
MEVLEIPPEVRLVPAILRMCSAIDARMAWVRRSAGTVAHVSSNADFSIEMVSAS